MNLLQNVLALKELSLQFYDIRSYGENKLTEFYS